MKTQHTPGPWVTTGWKECTVNSAAGNTIVAMPGGDGGPNGVELGECQANARLIAAAPELLEALVELDQWAQAQQAAEYPAGTFEVVHAAIKKAKGE